MLDMHNRYAKIKHLKFDIFTESMDDRQDFKEHELTVHYTVDRQGDAVHFTSQITTPHGEWVMGMAQGTRTASVSHRHWLKPMVFELKRDFQHLYLGRTPPLATISLQNAYTEHEGGPTPGIRLTHLDIEVAVGKRCALAMRLYPHVAGQGIYQQRGDLRTEAREVYTLTASRLASHGGIAALIKNPELFRNEELQQLFWISPTWRIVSLATLTDIPDEEFVQFFCPNDDDDQHNDSVLAS